MVFYAVSRLKLNKHLLRVGQPFDITKRTNTKWIQHHTVPGNSNTMISSLSLFLTRSLPLRVWTGKICVCEGDLGYPCSPCMQCDYKYKTKHVHKKNILKRVWISMPGNRSAKSAILWLWRSHAHVLEIRYDFMAQWQRVGFQTRRLGVRFPLRSSLFLCILQKVFPCRDLNPGLVGENHIS